MSDKKGLATVAERTAVRLRVPTSRTRPFAEGIARSAATAVCFAWEETRASTSASRAHFMAIRARDSIPSTKNESEILTVRKDLPKTRKSGESFSRVRETESEISPYTRREEGAE